VLVVVVGGTMVRVVVGGASLVVAVATVRYHKGSQMLIQICPWNPCSSSCRPRGIRQNCTEDSAQINKLTDQSTALIIKRQFETFYSNYTKDRMS
jgi:hypothetical protein